MRVEGDGKVNHMKLIANLFLKMQKNITQSMSFPKFHETYWVFMCLVFLNLVRELYPKQDYEILNSKFDFFFWLVFPVLEFSFWNLQNIFFDYKRKTLYKIFKNSKSVWNITKKLKSHWWKIDEVKGKCQ